MEKLHCMTLLVARVYSCTVHIFIVIFSIWYAQRRDHCAVVSRWRVHNIGPKMRIKSNNERKFSSYISNVDFVTDFSLFLSCVFVCVQCSANATQQKQHRNNDRTE